MAEQSLPDSPLAKIFSAPPPALPDSPLAKLFSGPPPATPTPVFAVPADQAAYERTLDYIKAERDGRVKTLPEAGAPEPDYSEEGMRKRAHAEVTRQRLDEAEKATFEASRTPARRALDTLAFAAEIPFRTVTGGRAGYADALRGLGLNEAAGKQEAELGSFARAHEGLIEIADKVGAMPPGIPMLSTMAAPLKATTGAALAMRYGISKVGAEAKSAARAATTDARLADLGAFERANVRPFGPAFTETGTAGTVKQLSEAPIVGQPVRNALGEAVEGARDAGLRVADQYGDAATYRDAGGVIQGAVRRNVEEAGARASEIATSAGDARSMRQGGQSAEAGLERFKNERTLDRAATMSDAELSDVAATPARETGVKSKQDALYERAWRGLPEDMRDGRSRPGFTRFMSGLTNMRAVLNEITERNMSMIRQTRMENGRRIQLPPEERRVAYPIRGGLAGQMVQDIIETTSTRSLQDTRNMRSDFRRLASGVSDTEKNTLTLSDMRRVQSAATQDMIDLLQNNANHYRQRGDLATAARIERSIHDFRRADQFTRASAARLETLEKLYGATSSEGLAKSVLQDAQGGNAARLTALQRSIPREDWGDVASGVISEMGRPAATARGVTQEAGFSGNAFIDNAAKLSPEGVSALFGHDPALKSAFQGFVGQLRRSTGPLERLYGNRGAEDIALEVIKDANGGRKGGNLARLAQLKGNMTPEEWGDVASAALREMGKPVASARGTAQEAGFSVQSAFTRWQTMSPEGRAMLFGTEGARVQSLNDFIRVADRLANFEAFANTSRSATGVVGMTGLASIFTSATSLMMGNVAPAFMAGSVGGGMYGFAKFISSPAYVRWLTRTVELSRDPRWALTLRDHARALAELATKEADPQVELAARVLAIATAQTADSQLQRLRQAPRKAQIEYRAPAAP
jgi:hypothetical protein